MYTNYEERVEKADEIYYSNKLCLDGIKDYLKDIMLDIVNTNPKAFKEKYLELVEEKDGVLYIPVPKRIIEEIKEENK